MHKPMTLSLVPSRDGAVYLVLDNFGGSDGPTARPIRREPTGRPSWPISSPAYEHPVRVVAFNTAEGCAHDVTAEIAREALLGADHELAPAVRDFLERAP
jgi:hypothetical protein